MIRKFFILILFCIGKVDSSTLSIRSDDFSAILDDQQSIYGNLDTITPMPDQGGSFINDLYLIITSTGKEFVLKAENPNWKTRKTLNEVSAVRYIEKNTKIPVPHIIKYHNEITSSPLGIEYILMSRVQGKALNLVIEEIYPDKKIYLQILNDLADTLATLNSIQFEYMGNVESEGNGLVVVSPIEFPNSVISKPCHKFSEYGFAWLLYYTNEMKRLKKANHPNQQHFSRLIPRLENMLKTKNFSILDDPTDLFVYCHQDFVMKNILVDNGRVSAILDWEWSGPALPEFEIQTGFDFLRTEEDRILFEKLMAERGVPNFFRPPPPTRQLFYDLVGHLYALISCYEWIEGRLDHSAKFLAQKLEQRMVKKEKHFNMERFVNDKTEMVEQILSDFEFSQESY